MTKRIRISATQSLRLDKQNPVFDFKSLLSSDKLIDFQKIYIKHSKLLLFFFSRVQSLNIFDILSLKPGVIRMGTSVIQAAISLL